MFFWFVGSGGVNCGGLSGLRVIVGVIKVPMVRGFVPVAHSARRRQPVGSAARPITPE